SLDPVELGCRHPEEARQVPLGLGNVLVLPPLAGLHDADPVALLGCPQRSDAAAEAGPNHEHVVVEARHQFASVPKTAPRMPAPYWAGSSSQTKCPALMTVRRLLGSRSKRKVAFASGTTLSWSPQRIVTGVRMPGSSSASSGSCSG